MLSKLIKSEVVRWIVASIIGIVVAALGYSYTLGSRIGEHLAADREKWQTNESDHIALRELADKTSDRLDAIGNRVASIEGKVDTLLTLQGHAHSPSNPLYAQQGPPAPKGVSP